MNYKIKNWAFGLLDKFANGDKLYYWIQKNVTKSVVLDDKSFVEAVKDKVSIHLEAIRKYGISPLCAATFFEFGAGWDLLAPIGFCLSGVKKYVAIDLNEYVRCELVKRTLELYLANAHEIEGFENTTVLRQESTMLNKLANACNIMSLRDFLNAELNLDYCAPEDARNTKLESESVDYVVSNVTLEHIPEKDIELILKECYRILRPGGIVSMTIDYTDHWAHSDKHISYFNYMIYSEAEWKKYNPPRHYQNRLQHSDYVKLFENAGFSIINQRKNVIEADRKALEKLRINEVFKKYDMEELLIRGAHFVVQKSLK